MKILPDNRVKKNWIRVWIVWSKWLNYFNYINFVNDWKLSNRVDSVIPVPSINLSVQLKVVFITHVKLCKWIIPKKNSSIELFPSRPDLYDVTIISEDGKIISGHKCILTSRLDYFRSMFLADWMEVRILIRKQCIGIYPSESNKFRIEDGDSIRSSGDYHRLSIHRYRAK